MLISKKYISAAIIILTVFLITGFVCEKIGLIDSVGGMIFPAIMVYIVYLYQNRDRKNNDKY